MAESMTNVTEFSFPWGHHCPLLLYEWKHTVDSHWFTITPPVGQGWNCTLFVFNTLSYFQFMELNEGVRSHGSDIILNMRNTSQMGNNLLLWGYFRKPRWHISKRIAEVIEAISLQLWLLCAPLLNITTAEMRPWGSLSLRKWKLNGLKAVKGSADHLKCYADWCFGLCRRLLWWHSSRCFKTLQNPCVSSGRFTAAEPEQSHARIMSSTM